MANVERKVVTVCGLALVLSAMVFTSQSAVEARDRWKLDNEGHCYFDPEDSGPDQCQPLPGRWKVGEGNICYFEQEDEGPNQCEPPAFTLQ